MSPNLTKAEQKILDLVRRCNDQGALAGLQTSPERDDYQAKEHRFIRRLAESKDIVWVPHTKELGAGWATPRWVKENLK